MNIFSALFLPSDAQQQQENDRLRQELKLAHLETMNGHNLAAKLTLNQAGQETGKIARTTQEALAIAEAPTKAADAVKHAAVLGSSAVATFALVLVLGYAAVEGLVRGKA